tara:strand:- start:846 stop:1046 length:201 start_codon:yes stop_codon:yes gene_type:complete
MWEYKMVDLIANKMGLQGKLRVPVNVEQILNEMGLLGWELISIDRQTSLGRNVEPSGFAYFKRPLK